MLTGCLTKVSGLLLMTILWSSPLGSLRSRALIKKRFVIITDRRSDSPGNVLCGLIPFIFPGIEKINFRVCEIDKAQRSDSIKTPRIDYAFSLVVPVSRQTSYAGLGFACPWPSRLCQILTNTLKRNGSLIAIPCLGSTMISLLPY